MREFRSYGSVRGALSNERPYREFPQRVQTGQKITVISGRTIAPANPGERQGNRAFRNETWSASKKWQMNSPAGEAITQTVFAAGPRASQPISSTRAGDL